MRDVRRLICHRDTPTAAVESIDACIERNAAGLAVTYTLEGKLSALLIPPEGAARSGERLWQHTCFELFVRPTDADRYHELNFSPSHEWAAYAFARYREGASLNGDHIDPVIAVRSVAGKLELDATIGLERLSRAYATAGLSIGLSAVVEAVDGSLSYWALAHPPGKPDFHYPDTFRLRLE